MSLRATLASLTRAVAAAALLSLAVVPAAFPASAAGKKADIEKMAQDTLQRLYAAQPAAKKAVQGAAGYAVFSAFGTKIFVAGGGSGSGLAVYNASKQKVYMKMGTAGLGLGLGGQKYKIVFFFEDEKAFRSFVDKGWQADASAQAAAAKAGANAASTFSDGVAFFQLTDKGLIASADISGTKYWKNEGLNKVK